VLKVLQALTSFHQNNKLLFVHDKRCLVSRWPPASEIGMLLITNFLELRVVAGISRTLAGRKHAVTLQWLREIALRKAYSWHGMCESNTAALCKSNGKDTI
jgi:hypothetical protein